jgi:hypothetical protein
VVAQSDGQKATAVVVTRINQAGAARRLNDVRVDDGGIGVPVEEEIYRARGYQPPVSELPWQEDYFRQHAPAKSYFPAMTDDSDFPNVMPQLNNCALSMAGSGSAF